ncbi:nucleotidyltransferase domain-containing protein [Nakamurella sp.]|uniref:nucleotidyltransferase domain-containing protein n=1 Tax=Nakamurella sp. TaxID=1869182 RepID=UPI003B3A83DE
MNPPDPAVRDYLTELARRCRDVVGADLVGVYAGGSLALDGYRPGRSDIDVAVVVAGRLDGEAKCALVAALRHENLPCPARGLELVVYRAEVAAAGGIDPGFEVELNSGARMDFRATQDPADRPAADGQFWYAIDRGILADHGRAIVGPPAATVFAGPGDWELRGLLAESLRWHLQAPAAASDDAVLNACRALCRVRSGRWLAKPVAGAAVRAQPGTLDTGIIRAAFRARDGGPPPDVAAVRRFQRDVLRLIEG